MLSRTPKVIRYMCCYALTRVCHACCLDMEPHLELLTFALWWLGEIALCTMDLICHSVKQFSRLWDSMLRSREWGHLFFLNCLKCTVHVYEGMGVPCLLVWPTLSLSHALLNSAEDCFACRCGWCHPWQSMVWNAYAIMHCRGFDMHVASFFA